MTITNHQLRSVYDLLHFKKTFDAFTGLHEFIFTRDELIYFFHFRYRFLGQYRSDKDTGKQSKQFFVFFKTNESDFLYVKNKAKHKWVQV